MEFFKKIKLSVQLSISTVLLLTPGIVSAQSAINPGPAEDTLFDLGTIIGASFAVIIGFAVFLFMWGLLRYILNSDDVAIRKQSRGFMIWGVVIIFVMISIWGLVNFLGDVIDLRSDDVPDPPGFPGDGGGGFFGF